MLKTSAAIAMTAPNSRDGANGKRRPTIDLTCLDQTQAFRRHIAHTDGAARRPAGSPPLGPMSAVERAAAPVSPFPTIDEAGFGGSKKNTTTAFAGARLHCRRSHGPGIRAEWSQSGALRRPSATGTVARKAVPGCAGPRLVD